MGGLVASRRMMLERDLSENIGESASGTDGAGAAAVPTICLRPREVLLLRGGGWNKDGCVAGFVGECSFSVDLL